jgi:LCP family protein required for cell wall assembly
MVKQIFFTIFGSVFILILFLVIASYYLLRTVSIQTQTPISYFPNLFLSVKNNPSLSPNINFLILGLDPRNDKLEKTETTDTIMLANLSPDWQINLISIPRDLWSYPLNTKINQIYPLSIGQSNQFQYIQDNFSYITGQKIDRTIVLTTQNLITLTNIVGGIDLYQDVGFIDKQYPNPEYIKNPSPKIPVYKTVEFPSGWIHLDESNITEFVRSRKSSETATNGGTDLGRIKRQQLLIDALILKIKSPDFLRHPQNLFALYNFWKTQITSNFTDHDLLSLGYQGYPYISQVKINKFNIPAGENPKTDIIYHPSKFINKQWVFIPQDKNYTSLHQFIKLSFYDNNQSSNPAK